MSTLHQPTISIRVVGRILRQLQGAFVLKHVLVDVAQVARPSVCVKEHGVVSSFALHLVVIWGLGLAAKGICFKLFLEYE